MKVRNTFIIFLVSGFWHGANWTFLIWGFLNALYIMPSIIFKTNRNNLDIVAQGKLLPSLRELFSMGITFGFTVFAWIFFRSKSVVDAFNYIFGIFSSSIIKIPYFQGIGISIPTFVFLLLFLIVEWIGREQQYAIQFLCCKWTKSSRWAFYSCIILVILYYFVSSSTNQQFIYFQF